jgi:hypothetical protein
LRIGGWYFHPTRHRAAGHAAKSERFKNTHY